MDTSTALTLNVKFSCKKLEKALAPGHTLQTGEAEQYEAILLDTFDGELAKSANLLLESEDRLLFIDTLNGTVLSQEGKAAGYCLPDIQPGPVRERITAVSSLRAFIPLAKLQLTTRMSNMLDDERKTVARLIICTFKQRKKVTELLICTPLRGYQPEFDKLHSAITAIADSSTGSLQELLVPGTASYDPKPEITLDPAAPIYTSANTIIATCIKVARQNEAGIIADIDTEFLHDYRVNLRKVRSVISLFKDVYSPDQTIQLKQEFADLMQITGRLRDLDVYLLDRQYYYTLVPASTHAGLDIMFESFIEERIQLQKNISKALKSKAYRSRLETLSGQCTDTRWQQGPDGQQPSAEFGCRLILKRYNKVCQIARTIDGSTADATVHELRIHCKKLRYLMEFFTPLFDTKLIKTLIKSLKILQDNLGKFNDFSVQQVSLADFLANRSSIDADNIKVAESIGGLIAMLSHLQKQEKEQVMANFARFDSEATRTLFHDLFFTGD